MKSRVLESSQKQSRMQQHSVGRQQSTGHTNGRMIWPRPPPGSVSASQTNPGGSEDVPNRGPEGPTQQSNIPGGPQGVSNQGQKDPAQMSRRTDPESVPFHGQKLHHREYVNEQGFVVKKKKTKTRRLMEHAVAHVAVCLCCAWVCTAPCCCGV